MIVPTVGAAGPAGTALIITLEVAVEIQPVAEVKVKLYVPGLSHEIVLFVPDPVIAPGLIVQVPLAGIPDRSTLPVAKAHVG